MTKKIIKINILNQQMQHECDYLFMFYAFAQIFEQTELNINSKRGDRGHRTRFICCNVQNAIEKYGQRNDIKNLWKN